MFDLKVPGETGVAVVHGDLIQVATEDDIITVDPRTGAVTDREPALIDVFMAPQGDALWASDFENDSVTLLDPATGKVRKSFGTGRNPAGVAVAAGSLWVANHRGGSVSRLDPHSGAVLATIPVGPEGPSGPQPLVANDRYLFVGVPNTNSVARIDMRTNTMVDSMQVPQPAVPCGTMTLDGPVVWVTSCEEKERAARLDFATGTAKVSPILGGYAGAAVVADDVVWFSVARANNARLVALDDNAHFVAQYRLPGGSIDGAVGLGAMWLPSPAADWSRCP